MGSILRVYMVAIKRAKLFRNGQSQAVRLPKELRFEGTEVRVKRIGDAVVLLPAQGGWGTLLESLSLFTPDFLEERGQPKGVEREDLFS
jgi:antitoxin VapB